MNRGLNYRDYNALSDFAGTVKYFTTFCLLKNWLWIHSQASDKSNDKNSQSNLAAAPFSTEDKKCWKIPNMINNCLVSSMIDHFPWILHISFQSLPQFCEGEGGSRGSPSLVHQAPLGPTKPTKLDSFFVCFCYRNLKNIFKNKILNGFYQYHYSLGISWLQLFTFSSSSFGSLAHSGPFGEWGQS